METQTQEKPAVAKALLRADEAAAYLGIGRTTLWLLTKDGLIRCTKPTSRAVRWSLRELDRFIARRTRAER